MPLLSPGAQVPAGRQRVELQVSRLTWVYSGTGANTVSLVDASEGTLFFVGRVATVNGNVTTYSYNILFTMELTSLWRDAAGRIFADIPTYINAKSVDLLYVSANETVTADDVLAGLPVNALL